MAKGRISRGPKHTLAKTKNYTGAEAPSLRERLCVSPPDQTADKPKELIWVRDLGGRPQIRWRRVVVVLLAVLACCSAASLAMSWFTGLPFRWTSTLMFVCGWTAYLVLAVELQRQRVLAGRWRFRISLGALLVMMGIGCAFFALAGGELRQNERWQAANRKLTADLEAVMRGGRANVGGLDGSYITCQATRPDFDDDDLARLIELASHGESGKCELAYLFLGGTKISPAGVRRLAGCKKLELLDIPSMPLDDAAIDAIAGCKALQFLLLDEGQLTEPQLARLKQALPKVRLNGTKRSARKPVL